MELKALDPTPQKSIEVCERIGAEDRGEIWQRDTYFQVPSGGLKLREERPGRPHLIQFARTDEPRERESEYRIVGVEDARELAAVLSACLGVRAVVSKRRRLFLWQHVRIHLDDVEGLGTFIEFEAVASERSDLVREHDLVRELLGAFAVADDRIVAHGYADLGPRPARIELSNPQGEP